MTLRNNLLVLMAALAICGTSAASPGPAKIVSVEIGIEASTGMTTFPLTNTGAIVLSCATCKPRSYRLTPQTTYFVGTSSVTLAQLHAFAASGPSQSMTIFVTLDESAVNRIVVLGQLNTRTAH